MTEKKVWVALIAVAIIAVTGLFTPAGKVAFGALADSTNYTNLGAKTFKTGTGCDSSSTWSTCVGLTVDASGTTVTGNLTQGGGVTATSSAASAVLQAADFDVENGIEVSLPVSAVTLTFPASTTFPLGTTPGSYRQFTMFNASTTAGATVTIAGGTGSLLEVASSTLAAGLKVIEPSGVAVFTAWRKANSDIEIFMNPGQ